VSCVPDSTIETTISGAYSWLVAEISRACHQHFGHGYQKQKEKRTNRNHQRLVLKSYQNTFLINTDVNLSDHLWRIQTAKEKKMIAKSIHGTGGEVSSCHSDKQNDQAAERAPNRW
jgi:hypothetical protein